MRYEEGNIKLSPNPDENYIQIDNEDFLLSPLKENWDNNKGSSANLFILTDPNGDTEDKVIKICRTLLTEGRNKKITRFKREIKAFRIASENNLTNVLTFFKSAEVEICEKYFLAIIIEKAQDDLPSFLESKKFNFSPNQKLTFCLDILHGVKQLHSVGIYHRDIKHDNILLTNNGFKVGDLGLVKFQNEDFEIDGVNEKIGPKGWLTPEATNKMLTNKKKIGYTYDCNINQRSDIFQLGKLFWYIFQGNLPIGQIINADSKFNDDEIFQILFWMLQYEKERRPRNIQEIEERFEPLKMKYAV